MTNEEKMIWASAYTLEYSKMEDISESRPRPDFVGPEGWEKLQEARVNWAAVAAERAGNTLEAFRKLRDTFDERDMPEGLFEMLGAND